MSEFEYRTNSTIRSLVDRLTSARSVMILSHEKPDGDAIGSCAMVARALDAIGVPSETCLIGAVADSLRSLIPDLAVREIPGEEPVDAHDLIVLVDTGAWAQLAPVAEVLRESDAIASLESITTPEVTMSRESGSSTPAVDHARRFWCP